MQMPTFDKGDDLDSVVSMAEVGSPLMNPGITCSLILGSQLLMLNEASV
jgi:hypothetical protein